MLQKRDILFLLFLTKVRNIQEISKTQIKPGDKMKSQRLAKLKFQI